MLLKFTSLLLVVLLFGGSAKIAYANNSSEEKAARFATKVKENIEKLGIGKEAQVEIKLRDNTKVKGYIAETGAESFVVVNEKTGASVTAAYSTVKQIKGNNLNSGVKFVIILAVAVAAILIFVSIGFAGGTDH